MLARPVADNGSPTTHSMTVARRTTGPTFGHASTSAQTASTYGPAWRSELRPDVRARSTEGLRSRAVLVTELSQLEADAKTVDADDPSRAPFFLRIAAAYDELRAVAESEGDTELAARARTKAHEMKHLVVRRYPDAPYLDKPLFDVADELEHTEQRAGSFVLYRELVKKFPASPYAPYAYLAMGEEYFELASRHPEEWPQAIAMLQKAITPAAPGNRVHGYALYKLAWAYEKSGDHSHARQLFQEVVDVAAANPSVPDLVKLGEAAHGDLASM